MAAETGTPSGPVQSQSFVPTWAPRSLTGTTASGEGGTPSGATQTQSFVPTWPVRT